MRARGIETFWSMSINKFWSGKYQQSFGLKMSQEKSAIFTKISRIIPFFNPNPCIPNCVKILIIHTTQTTYYWTSPILCY